MRRVERAVTLSFDPETRGLAIAVIGLTGRDEKVRCAQRLVVAMAAYRGGYFLVDTFEINTSDDDQHATTVYAQVAALAADTDAEAIFVRGPVDRAVIEQIADEVRMLIRETDGLDG